MLEVYSRGVAAKGQGVTRQTLADSVRLYDHGRPEGLRPRPRGGSACRLTERQQRELRSWLEDGPDWERDGLVCWRVVRDNMRCGSLEGTSEQRRGFVSHERDARWVVSRGWRLVRSSAACVSPVRSRTVAGG